MSKTVLTPADLDLKVKDRIPGYFPKVGDLVKIKSRGWYEKWKNQRGNVDLLRILFTPKMTSHCGCYRKIRDYEFGKFSIYEDNGRFSWTLECFEEVIPVEEAVAVTDTASIDTDPTDVNYLNSYSGTVLSGSITADDCRPISLLSGYGGMTAEEAIKAFTIKDPPVIHFPNNSGTEEPPQLNTIKRKRFVKIKNL